MTARTADTADGLVLSHRSSVNSWECDENLHWNVQFYVRAFQHAAETLALHHTGCNPGADCAAIRHVRYHRELPPAASIDVYSGRIADGTLAGNIVHMMVESQQKRLAATAIDTPRFNAAGIPAVAEAEVKDAMPRSLGPAATPAADTEAMLKAGAAIVSNTGMVRPREMDHDGRMLANEIVSRFTDGAPHAWHHLGVTTEWLEKRRLGRVAVEMKLTRLAHPSPGEAMRLVSWGGDAMGRTFLLRHQLENPITGSVVATGEVRCLLMDQTTRKAVNLPDPIAQAVR